MSEEITIQEAGRRGGSKTRERYGREHFRAMGEKGGKATLQRHGAEHFKRIGKKGGSAMRRLVEAGKAASANVPSSDAEGEAR